MAKIKEQPFGPAYGFALRKARKRPPIEVDPREWARRTQSRGYIRAIKRSVQLVDQYLYHGA